jgi:protocatechuate 3,4-dioxygenase beta subunit
MFGQNAELTGLILDSSGAAIPNAKVEISNTEKGTTQTTNSNAEGNYTVTALIPGRYEIVVSSNGFEGIRRQGVTLQVGQQARVDFTLQPDSTTQSIDVSVDVAAVNAERVESAVSLEPKVLQDRKSAADGGR